MSGVDATSDPRAVWPSSAAQLAAILEIVCSAGDADTIVHRLGTGGPNESAARSARIEPTHFPGVRWIDFRPWDADEFGIVELELAADADWRVADLQPLLGELRMVPGLHRPGHRLQGAWERPGWPAWAAVFLDVADAIGDPAAPVWAVLIRTEPPAD